MLTLALPKGRIMKEALPLLARAQLAPATAVSDDDERKITVNSMDPNVRLIIVRAADIQTYVSYGAAQFGLVGRDMLLEHPTEGIFHDVDLQIAKCNLVVAARQDFDFHGVLRRGDRLTVATKYPRLARHFFGHKGVQTEIVRLYGAMELAPTVGLSDVIVDLVATGATLRANNLVTVAQLMEVSTHLVVNQAASWRRRSAMAKIIARIAAAASTSA